MRWESGDVNVVLLSHECAQIFLRTIFILRATSPPLLCCARVCNETNSSVLLLTFLSITWTFSARLVHRSHLTSQCAECASTQRTRK